MRADLAASVLYESPHQREGLARQAPPPAVSEPVTGLEFTRLGALLDEPEEAVRWLVEDRLPSGGLSILAGKPKAGKSTLARGLALAVARGEPWLGWETAKGRVFYLALEEKRSEVRAHFAAMGGTRDDDVDILVAQAPADAVLRLREAAQRERPALIIVDPLFRFVRVKDGNDYAEMSRALEPLLALARDTGAHVLVVHHLGKGEREGADAILGSTAIRAAVDTSLLLRRTEKYRTLASEQRYGADLPEITLNLEPVTRTITVGPARAEADMVEAGAAILDFLRTADEPATEATIHEAVEGRKAVKERALRRLVSDRKVLRSGAGRRSDPYRYAISPSLPPTTPREAPEGETKPSGSSLLWPPGFRVASAAVVPPRGTGTREGREVDPWA
jgi:hypothetical protein